MEFITEDVLQTTEEYWNLPSKSIYHECISLIISQRIAFKDSRRIRKSLYEKIGDSEFTYHNLRSFSETELYNLGVTVSVQNVIFSIPEDITDFDDLKEIRGIGDWTVNALKIKCTDEDIFLSEDLWIRKHIRLLLDLESTPTIAMVKRYISEHVPYNRSILTKFLWRLKHVSIKKLKTGIQLTKEDFI